MKISRAEFERIRNLKTLDIQQCSFCQQITILNLGWLPFQRLHCQACQEVHILCPELCLKVARNIFDCHLFQEYKPVDREIVPPNRPYDKCACYLCGKELRGAGKTGKIKNRNNPSFWGVESAWKILCLQCIGKRYLNQLSGSKRKTWQKYVKRGYV